MKKQLFLPLKTVVLLLPIFLATSCSHTPLTPHSSAKNLILFIGDGMGVSHISATRLYDRGATNQLNLERMSYTAMSRTYSSNNYTTDSAASGTALSTGVKTYNGSIAMSDAKYDPTGKSRRLESIAKLAKAAGKSVGIITTTRITHATPAVFYAHVIKRDNESEIARQLVNSHHIDLALGGGRAFFLPKQLKGKRKDGKNLIQDAIKKGWTIVSNEQQLQHALGQPKILGLFTKSHMNFDIDRKRGEPSLKMMVDFAIKQLSKNPKGFFLMVEAGRIDHASHKNLVSKAVTDLLAMDRALPTALQLPDTLTVLTADHETGGLAINGYGDLQVSGNKIFKNKSGSKLAMSHKKGEKQGLISWASGPGYKSSMKVDEKVKHFHHRATYKAKNAYHTATDVLIAASGPGSSQFHGFMKNSDIPQILAGLMGWSFNHITAENQNKAP